MKIPSSSQIHDDAVTNFCASRKDAFDDWCKREAYFLVDKKTIFIGPVLLILVSCWNLFRTGLPLSLLSYSFPTALLFLMALKPILFVDSARKFLDIAFTAIVIGALGLMHLASTSNFPLQLASTSNFPLQMALLAATALTFQSTLLANVLRTVWFFSISCVFIALSPKIFFEDVAVQLFTGSGVGLLFAFHSTKKKMQQYYSESLNTDMLNHAFNELKKVVPPHVVSLIQERNNLETTMPTTSGDACVLAFDVVKSSRIKHPDLFRVVENAKNRCYRMLYEGYKDDGSESLGFRLKDTGDGFLCSIGYPYRTPAGKPVSLAAHQIAERCCKIFDEEMAALSLPSKPRCSIGIAFGEICGFFPEEVPRQYDLRGQVIMLATRYEAMRNRILDENGHGPEGNIIFIQEAVWLGLHPHERNVYQVWECDASDKKVRDDPTAQRAYYRFVTEVANSLQINALHDAS